MSEQTAATFFAALNARDYDAVRALMAVDCRTGLPGVPPGATGYVALARQMVQAFPDLHHEIIELIGAGDRVTVITRNSGTQAAAFMGHMATGRRFNAIGIDVLQIAEGRIVQRTGVFDTVTMLHQLGLYQ